MGGFVKFRKTKCRIIRKLNISTKRSCRQSRQLLLIIFYSFSSLFSSCFCSSTTSSCFCSSGAFTGSSSFISDGAFLFLFNINITTITRTTTATPITTYVGIGFLVASNFISFTSPGFNVHSNVFPSSDTVVALLSPVNLI